MDYTKKVFENDAVLTMDDIEKANKVSDNVDEKIKDATKAKEVTNRIDEIIIDYLDLMFDTIERDCIYSVFKAVLKHITSRMNNDVTYREAARIASSFTSDMLAVLAEKDMYAEGFCDDDDDEYCEVKHHCHCHKEETTEDYREVK